MDGLKLQQWKNSFLQKADTLELRFSSLFKNGKLADYYEVSIDNADELYLKIREGLPNEIEEHLIKALTEAKPEDSI